MKPTVNYQLHLLHGCRVQTLELASVPSHLHRYGLSGLLPVKNSAGLELRLQGVLPDGGPDGSPLAVDDDVRVSTCAASQIQVQAATFADLESKLGFSPPPSPPVLSWFCSPSDSCTYTWVTTCGYPRKELQHLTFGLSCISSLLAERYSF